MVGREGEYRSAEIIDYKTDRTPDDPARLASFATRYRPQLAAYADAVAEMFGVPRASCSATLVLLERRRGISVEI